MFKAKDLQAGKDIIILDKQWNRDTVELLRAKCREDGLQCPECKQPVLVKAGDKKRWHFAHRDIGNCALKNESPAILQARSLLYTWLNTKYPDKVTIEKRIPGAEFPRPIDCYVETERGKKLAYWILEAGIRSKDELLYEFKSLHVFIHWVFLANMLKFDRDDNPHSDNPHSIELTPTERTFSYTSEYNTIYSASNKALNYLNIEEQTLITLRGLWCIHAPRQYTFKKLLRDKLSNVLICPKTGEFIYGGEYKKLQQHRERQRHQLLEPPENISSSSLSPSPQPLSSVRPKDSEARPLPNYLTQAFSCQICGVKTHDWIKLNTSTNTCICRKCSRKSDRYKDEKEDERFVSDEYEEVSLKGSTSIQKKPRKKTLKVKTHLDIKRMVIGYSGFHDFEQCYEYNEDACYIADTPESLQEFLSWANWPVKEYRIDPVTIAGILKDVGGSLGEYALEPNALKRFEKAAKALGIGYTVKPYDSMFDPEPRIFIVKLKGTLSEIL